ncbi:MAG: glycosyltransferase family 39 protein [Euryarchaeota archaeon]|nr:glycosyltransferase family 39 protein [Euryarchaeota archaeon]
MDTPRQAPGLLSRPLEFLRGEKGRWLLLVPMALMLGLGQAFPPISDPATFFYDARQVLRDPGQLADPRIIYYPPFLLVAGAGALAMAGEIGIRLIAPLVSSLGLLATYLLGREIVGHRAALLGALLYGLFPLSLHLGSLGYLDGLVTGFCMVTLYSFHRAVHGRGTRWALLAGAAGGLAALSKATGPMALLFIAAYTLARTLRDRRLDLALWKTSLLALLAGGLLGAPYYLRNLLLWRNPFGGEGWSLHFTANPYPNAEFNRLLSPTYRPDSTPLDFLAHQYYESWGIPIGDPATLSFLPPGLLTLYLLTTLPATAIALYGITRGLRDSRRTQYLLLWLLLWLAAMLITGPRGLAYSIRRILPAFPILALLAALGYQRLEEHLPRLWAAITRRPALTPAATRTLPRVLSILLILLLASLVAGEVAKTAYAHQYVERRQDLFQYIRTLPADAILLSPDQELVHYYADRRSYYLPSWRLDKFDIPYFQKNLVGYIVTSDDYYITSLAPYQRILDEKTARGLLQQTYRDAHHRVYRVEPLPGPPPTLDPLLGNP